MWYITTNTELSRKTIDTVQGKMFIHYPYDRLAWEPNASQAWHAGSATEFALATYLNFEVDFAPADRHRPNYKFQAFIRYKTTDTRQNVYLSGCA